MKKLTKLFGLMIFASTLFTGCDHDASNENAEIHNIEDDFTLTVNVSIDADEIELSNGIWDVLESGEYSWNETFSSGIQAQVRQNQLFLYTIRRSDGNYAYTAQRGLTTTRWVLPENTSDTNVENAKQEVIEDMIRHDEREGGPGYTVSDDGTFMQETEYSVIRIRISTSGKTIIQQDAYESTEAGLAHDDTPEDLLEYCNRDSTFEIRTNSGHTQYEAIRAMTSDDPDDDEQGGLTFRFKKR